MTNAEVIETLRANYPDACYEQLREAVDAAIEALKAQDAAGDAINRQGAIDALSQYPFEKVVNCVSIIEELPSAQPEQRWIPCSDENPKADGRYLITGKMGTVYSLDFEDGRWYGGIKPVAWMPLPEPWRGAE